MLVLAGLCRSTGPKKVVREQMMFETTPPGWYRARTRQVAPSGEKYAVAKAASPAVQYSEMGFTCGVSAA